MSELPDHYSILGLVPNADLVVIKAAYRALVAVYHPDKNERPEANEKIRQINSAYETLSDPTRRKLYDAERQPKEHSANSSAFERERPFLSDPIEHRWSIAISFYPDIDIYYKDLEKISWRLAFAFKLQLLEEQMFAKAGDMAGKFKTQYLSRYFGKNKDIVAYAEELIKAREVQAALYLNQVVNVMGSSVDLWQITPRINKEFPSLELKLNGRRLYARIRLAYGEYELDSARELARLNGGEVSQRFLSGKILATIDGEILSFKDRAEFCQHVLHRYAEQYA